MTSSDLSQRPFGHTVRFFCAALFAFAALAVLVAPRASAISDAEELTRIGGKGSGAGELGNPLGIGTDPVTGHVFTVEGGNDRISEFTPWGNFVKAFGWDVAPGAVNEQQEVRVRAAAGQFKLSFGASTTPDLAFNAPGAVNEGPGSVEAALNALPSIGAGGGEVRVQAVPGTPDGKAPTIYVVAFKGSLAATNVGELTPADGTTQLSGGDPTTSIEVRTRADGTAGGTGLESCTAESGCQAGKEGAGAGQFAEALGIAVDSAGYVYARERGNHRVQKFDSAGRFVLMFGGEVNKTTSANRCTNADLEGGEVCGIGVTGAGAGQFGDSNSPSIVLGAGNKLFVGDIERIQRFNAEGEWEASIPVSVSVSASMATVQALAIAPGSGDFYASVGPPSGTEENVRILDAVTGAEKGELQGTELKNSKEVGIPATKSTNGPIAIDPAGNVFALRNNTSLGQEEGQGSRLLQFNAARQQVSEFGRTLPNLEASALGTNAIGTLYVTASSAGVIIAFGPGPTTFEAPPPVPPTISNQYAISVDRTGAVLIAEINPHFWSDTRYYVQYGIGKCSEGGCTSEKPLSPGALLGTTPVAAAVRSSGTFIEGLEPGTTYHYRFVAESLGGGPVRGIGGEVGVDGEESTFITYPSQFPYKADCPNQAFRTGFSAPLPDCRAYEMVSPVDKNNGDIKTLVNIQGYRTDISQSAEDGSRLTYSSYRAFADPRSAPFTSQQLATRGASGWASEAIDPPQGEAANQNNVNTLGNNFKGFSADLCMGWLVVAPEPQLDPPRDAPDRPNLYRRQNCGAEEESYSALIPVESSVPEPQGASADGEAAVFREKRKLTPEAASGAWQAYYASEGALELLCLLPSGAPSGGNCSVGTGGESGQGLGLAVFGRMANVDDAISADGKRVYWTDSATQETGAGKVYLRINPGAEQSALSGETCTEEQKACTLKVSETKSTRDSRFLVASPDGAKALFEVTEGPAKGDLYEFDLEGPTRLIAGDVLGVAGTSEDLSRVYFVSEEALDGDALAGEPNLYLAEGKEMTFIATLSDTDAVIPPGLEEAIPSVTARKPIYHAARASEDGSTLAFISNASLTGYDNTDLANGAADSEVYLYEVGSDGPVCVSCNPSHARPRGRVVKLVGGALPIAGTLSLPTTMLHAPRVLSADGSHLFFPSYDALLPRDTNGKADVYQWQAASSEEECKEKGAELYVASATGCLSLISSGESPQDSEFLDASQSGDDVFFTTQASLLPQDPGLIDIYDARASGGLPAPPEPPGPCQGEACQLAPPPPNDPTPGSASFKGAGNLKSTPRCRKGKVARKGRCVAKKKRKASKRHAKRTNRNRRASR
jgi:hypothetical protein